MGICGHMDEQKEDFSYMIGLFAEKETDTHDFTVIKAPAAAWAVFRSEYFDQPQYGAQLPKLFQGAYTEWLPSSGYEKILGLDGEIYDMEIYGVTDNGKYFEEAWLSVVKK